MTVDNEKTYQEAKKVSIHVLSQDEVWECLLVSYNRNGVVVIAYGNKTFIPYTNIGHIEETDDD